MTPATAATQWKKADAQYRDAKKRRDDAAEVLKVHFRASDVAVYRGVRYARSTVVVLVAAKARALLGKRASEAEVESVRETLSAA